MLFKVKGLQILGLVKSLNGHTAKPAMWLGDRQTAVPTFLVSATLECVCVLNSLGFSFSFKQC